MTEPKQEKWFIYKGFPCVILFRPLGYRCGYVGIPKGDKFYGEGYGNLDIDCHGGLTYASGILHGQSDEDVWWIGFDCAHCWDGRDVEKLKEYYPNDKTIAMQIENGYYADMSEYCKIRTLEYCEAQCKSIVEQLIEMEGTK